MCPYAKIGNTVVFCFQFCDMRVRKRKKTECDYFLKEKGCCDWSFDMFSYESVAWLPSLSCAMALKLTSKGLKTFCSCLLSTCETAHYNTRCWIELCYFLLLIVFGSEFGYTPILAYTIVHTYR